ncbi:unnamed protein product [Gulo gulo]|uniref:Uncharacterized protein n=1 Tax=Gulo gulo TaxID=48420 RepID=A0A9X9Q5T4_GULGU|nr:unnamed protein product [Gulo gulo]
MSDMGATGKEREIAEPSSRRPSQPRSPAFQTPVPSPLDPWRCFPSSIPVQPLPVNIVTELLSPGLPLGFGHCLDHLTDNYNCVPLTRSASCLRLLPMDACKGLRAFSGNVVHPIETSCRLL